MRSYPIDSPEAAARIVALALLADGHFSRAEVEAMDRGGARAQLGLTPDQLHQVVHELCEDLLATCNQLWAAACTVDPPTLAALLDEVRDPMLRMQVLQLCILACTADGELADGESVVIRAAVSRWGLCAGHEGFERREAACRN